MQDFCGHVFSSLDKFVFLNGIVGSNSFLINNKKGSQLFYILTKLSMFFIFSRMYKGISLGDFTLYFPNDQSCLATFNMLIFYFSIFFHVFCPFLLYCLIFIFSLKKLYIWATSLLSNTCIMNISPVHFACLFSNDIF